MADVWFCSDLHFGHKNIGKFREPCGVLSEQHNREKIMDEWMTNVTKRGVVYVLGDACFTMDTIDDWALAVVPVGSRVTCNPPPQDTDQDLLVLVEDYNALEQFEQRLEMLDWESESEGYKENAAEFNSWRKEVDGTEYNIILTENEKWFDTFLDATFSCKEKNLLTKDERIAEFEKFFGPKKKPMAFKPFYDGGVGTLPTMAEMELKIIAMQQKILAKHAAQQAQQNLWANPFAGLLQGQQANVVIYDDLDVVAGTNKVYEW